MSVKFMQIMSCILLSQSINVSSENKELNTKTCTTKVPEFSVVIRCITNCGNRTKIYRILELRAEADRLDQEYSYNWQVTEGFPVLNASNSRVNRQRVLIILPNVLRENSLYTFSVTVFPVSCPNTSVTTVYQVHTLAPLTQSGSLLVLPAEGGVLDEFRLSAAGFDDPHRPFMYEFYARTDPGEQTSTLLYGGPLSKLDRLFLPCGTKINNYDVEVKVVVTNRVGARASAVTTVKVRNYEAGPDFFHAILLDYRDFLDKVLAIVRETVTAGKHNTTNYLVLLSNAQRSLLTSGFPQELADTYQQFSEAVIHYIRDMSNIDSLSFASQQSWLVKNIAEQVVTNSEDPDTVTEQNLVDTVLSATTKGVQYMLKLARQRSPEDTEPSDTDAHIETQIARPTVEPYENGTLYDEDQVVEISRRLLDSAMAATLSYLDHRAHTSLNQQPGTNSTDAGDAEADSTDQRNKLVISSLRVLNDVAEVLQSLVPAASGAPMDLATPLVNLSLLRLPAREVGGATVQVAGGRGTVTLPTVDSGQLGGAEMVQVQVFGSERPLFGAKDPSPGGGGQVGVSMLSRGLPITRLPRPLLIATPLAPPPSLIDRLRQETITSSYNDSEDTGQPSFDSWSTTVRRLTLPSVSSRDPPTAPLHPPGAFNTSSWRHVAVVTSRVPPGTLRAVVLSLLGGAAWGEAVYVVVAVDRPLRPTDFHRPKDHVCRPPPDSWDQRRDCDVVAEMDDVDFCPAFATQIANASASCEDSDPGCKMAEWETYPLSHFPRRKPPDAQLAKATLVFDDGLRANLHIAAGQVAHGVVKLPAGAGGQATLHWRNPATVSEASTLSVGLMSLRGLAGRCGDFRLSQPPTDVYNDSGGMQVAVGTYDLTCVHYDEATGQRGGNGSCTASIRGDMELECACTHLSVFDKKYIVAPNEVNVFWDLRTVEVVYENPVTLVLVLIIWAIYAVLLVWGRRRDAADNRAFVVHHLVNNDPKNTYYYLVTFITGWTYSSGTSSIPAFVLTGLLPPTAGSDGHPVRRRSRIHVCYTLAHRSPVGLRAGSEESFLMAASSMLGELTEMEVWLSITGMYPCWFLNQVTVRDLQTLKEYHFVCNEWFYPQYPDSCYKILHVSTGTEGFSLRYRCKVGMTRCMQDDHLWAGFFRKPNYTTFTRAQRLTCILAYTLMSMMANMMWYGTGEGKIRMFELVDHKIVLNKTVIFNGVWSCLIALPLSSFIYYMFRCSKPRPTSEPPAVGANKADTIPLISPQPSGSSPPPGTTAPSPPTFFSRVAGSNRAAPMLRDQEEAKALRLERRLTLRGYPHGPTLQVPSLLSHMSAREKWKALGNKVISKRRAERAFLPTADIPDHAAFAAAVKAWASILNKNKNSNVENQSSSNNAKAKYIKEEAISMSERRSSTRVKSDGSLSYKTAEDIDDHSNPMYCLPWQMAPCTWVMSMTCCIGASFVVGLYGLTFGYASSVAWLGSILYSLTQAHWVLEPLTLAASTLLMCWFQPAPIVPMVTQYIDYKDRLGEQLNEQKMSELEKQNIWRANYVPTMAYIKLIGHRLMMEKKIRRKLRESTLWAVLILVTFTLVYAHFHHLAFYMYSSVGNTLIHAVHSQTIAFDRVETYRDVWEYLQTTLVAATLLPSTRLEYNSYLGDLSNILVGMPRLRQVRYSPGKCDVGWRLPISVRCRNEYSLINDDSQSYTPGWRSVIKRQTYVPHHHSSWNYVDDDHDHGNHSFGVNDTDYDDDHHHDNNTEMMVNPWSYQSAWDLGVPLTLGAYNTYSGGGYIFEISANINKTLEDLELLKAADWLNEDTAALIVELSVFNPVISMFMIVPLVFEFTQTGKVHPYYRNIMVCKLYNVVDVGDIYILLLQVVQVILVIIMCNRVYRLYHDDTHQFAVKLRNHWLEPLIILLNCMCLVTYAIKTWMVDRDVKRASEAKFRGFINWYEAAYWNYVYTYMGTVTTTMLLLNFLQVMSLNKRVLMFIRGLRKSLKQISGALVYVGLGFVILMIVGHIGTGTVLEESSTYSKTANTVLGMTIKDVNMDFKKAADSTSPYPAMFVVLTWVSIFCLFIPMIQVVVIHALKHARSQRVSTDLMEELEVAEYLFDHMLILLGWWGVDEFERKYERPLRFAALHDRSKNYPAAFKNSLLYELFGEESYTHVPKEDKEESDASSTDGSSKATSMWGKISAAMFSSKKSEKKSKDKSKEKK